MNFVLIIVALLVVVIIYVKLGEMKHHFFYKFLAVMVFLFVGSLAYVWLKSDINLSSYEGFLSLGRTYFSWLGSLSGNIGSITGDVVKHDWGVNSTIIPTS